MNRQIQNAPIEQRRSPKWWRVTSLVIVALVFGVLMCTTLVLAVPPSAPAVANLGQSTLERGGDDDYMSRYGIIVTRPVESVGTWVIGSESYSVTESTVLEGSLEQGVCVEVKALKSEPSTAVKIESKDAFKCNGNDDDNDGQGGHNDDDDFDRYGRLESRPEGKEGTWVVGGESYTATSSTDLDQEYGKLVVGICTKVHLLVSDPTVAREIESKADYKCSGRNDDDDDDSARGMLFGVIEQLPPDLQNGNWVIGGLSFVVSPTTELVSKGGIFTVGLTVKVDFTTNMSDTNFARRIEIKYGQGNPCRRHDDDRSGDDRHGDSVHHNGDDDDDRGYGYCPGGEGKTYGIIDSRPDGSLIGDWMIGGVPYVTTASTKFHDDDDFLAGERVKVEYVVVSDTLRYITKLKESDNNGGVSDPNHSLIVGYVDAKPVAFVGEWTINGAPFVAISDTVFIERGSLFAVGAYVVVEYEIVNDQRLIVKILTYVPPGAGEDDKIGRLEAMGGVVAAGTDTTLQNGQVWTVDGVDYVVSEATQLVDSGGDLVTGAVVYVNSYTADGQRYATMIRTQAGKAFIPMASR